MFFLFETCFRNGQKESAFEAILFAVLTEWWVRVGENVTPTTLQAGYMRRKIRCANLIFRLRQLSHARCVLVRFLVSIGVAELAMGGLCFGVSLEGPS